MTETLLNTTESFYKGSDASLFWEMTICQSLADAGGAYAKALSVPESYGAKVGRLLAESFGVSKGCRIVEVGGGYGTLMKELAKKLSPSSITMVDISPLFIGLQKEALSGFPGVSFVNADVFDWLDGETPEVELLVSNENIGDFPAVDNLTRDELFQRIAVGGPYGNSPFERAARLVESYRLELPMGNEPFALNVGALEYVEKLRNKAKTVFLSEHSADINIPGPWNDFLKYDGGGRPRRIELKGHAEYTIRFDHLQRAAEMNGFKCTRVSMLELLGVRADEGARFNARAECVGREAAEMMHEFLHHVKEYECLVLQR